MMLRLLLPPLLFFLVVSAEGFWIVAQPKEINWQQNCIQDKNCEDMELSIIMDSNSDELGSAQVSYKLDNALKNVGPKYIFLARRNFSLRIRRCCLFIGPRPSFLTSPWKHFLLRTMFFLTFQDVSPTCMSSNYHCFKLAITVQPFTSFLQLSKWIHIHFKWH